jgi:DNA ligase-1
MLFAEVAATSAAVAGTRSRLAKIEALVGCLRRLPADELVAGVAYLSGELRQRQIGVGWASLRDLPGPAELPSLSVGEVDRVLGQVGAESGAGSAGRRRELLAKLFAAATADEQLYLRGLLTGEVRQGALAGVVTDAVARAAEVPAAAVRRAVLLSGDLRAVAVAAMTGGEAELATFHLTVGRPLAPMLAQPAASIEDALTKLGIPGAAEADTEAAPAGADTGATRRVAVDDKLDGIRVQAHRDGDEVGVFTRSLDDITSRVPEIVAAVRSLPARRLVLDGEALGLDPTGRPLPFQVTSSRVGRRAPDPDQLPLHSYFFDLLHVDGQDVLDAPAAERWAALERLVPAGMRVGRRTVTGVDEAAAAFAAALDAGQEGVVVKDLGAPYEAGRRGGAWLKVKPRHTLDLVVLAAEWGHGRRRGWLSNLHLGAADGDGGWVMLGKTFKGLTDELLGWQTERLLALETRRDSYTVYVRPELVVEIAFDGVQASPRYPGGMALRFARVLRYRSDKTPAEADTVDTVRMIHGAR